MDACRICTLIFDRAPLELGRAQSDPTICCICEEAMYIIEPKRITTMTAVITLDETEVAALIVDPTPLINDLRNLNRAWQQPAPAKRAKPAPVRTAKQGKPDKKVKPLLHCQHGCGATFITAGRKANHEARCIDNPDRAIESGDD